jgi:hypothetical protein
MLYQWIEWDRAAKMHHELCKTQKCFYYIFEERKKQVPTYDDIIIYMQWNSKTNYSWFFFPNSKTYNFECANDMGI